MKTNAPVNIKQLSGFLRQGEGPTLEFKCSTGEMKEAMQTLCAFLNGFGGTLLFGIRPDATAEGQDVSDQTLRDIAQAAERFEPPAHLSIERVKVKTGSEVVAVSVESAPAAGPFTYEGRPYERVGSTTRKMPQAKYERRLLERAHSKRRWENEPAEGVSIKDIDRAGLIEKWGRGTNRVIEMCRKAGIRPPEFHEIAGSAVVKFHVPVGVTVQVTDQVTVQVTDQVERLLVLLGNRPMTTAEIMRGLVMNHRPTLRDNYLHPALQVGFIEMTVPDKPNSRLQKYRLTQAGERVLRQRTGGN